MKVFISHFILSSFTKSRYARGDETKALSMTVKRTAQYSTKLMLTFDNIAATHCTERAEKLIVHH